jgi:hypothetical protein
MEGQAGMAFSAPVMNYCYSVLYPVLHLLAKWELRYAERKQNILVSLDESVALENKISRSTFPS